jgi:hypothetical protein
MRVVTVLYLHKLDLALSRLNWPASHANIPDMALRSVGTLMFAIATSTGIAQQTSPTVLSICVADQSGARIPRAGIRAIDETTGTALDIAADTNGSAEIGLSAGTYTLHVRSPGFRVWEQKSLEIKQSMTKSVVLIVSPTDGYGWFPQTREPEIPIERQPLDQSIPLIPIALLDLSAKPIHHKFRL